MTLTTSPRAPAAGRAPWRVLPLVLAGNFLSVLDFFVVNVALPSIGRDLRASPAALELLVAGYAAAYASGLVVSGRLGDALGWRRTLSRLGIDIATLDLLSTLRRSGPPYRMSPSGLATACRVSRGAITQRVTRAAKAGLVSRAAGYHAHAITLTREGHALVESAVTRLLEYEQRLLDGLDADQQQRLADLLRDLLAVLGDRTDVSRGPLGQVGE